MLLTPMLATLCLTVAADTVTKQALPPHYVSQALAFKPDGEALYVGLAVTGDKENQQWKLDFWHREGGSWSREDDAGLRPPTRAGFRMVYDAANDQFVLFGGRTRDDTSLNDTWLCKDHHWRQWTGDSNDEKSLPPPRYIHGMAYDTIRRVTVLFGGRGPEACRYNDVWEFDGKSWKQTQAGYEWFDLLRTPREQWAERFPQNIPSPRYGPALAYDPTHERILMFGGYSPNGHDNDLWQYTKNGWRRIHGRIGPDDSTPVPIGSYGATMTFDPTTDTMILTGGLFDAGRTWRLDGDEWKMVDDGGGPPGVRLYTSLAFDPDEKAIVLIGGRIYQSENVEQFSRWWVWVDGDWRPCEKIEASPVNRASPDQ